MSDKSRIHVVKPPAEGEELAPKGSPSPDPDAGFYSSMRARCEAHRHGQRCLLASEHSGEHMAVNGPLLYWQQLAAAPTQDGGDHAVSALLWCDWARRLGVDAADMQVKLLESCRSAKLHPAALLLHLVNG